MRLGANLFLHRDSANVYVIRSGRRGTCIDIGNGSIFDSLEAYGVDVITDVVMTHHHRDGAQGLHRAAEAGARIWVPAIERDLFERVEEHWQARPIVDMYDLREDRFSLFDSVPVSGAVDEYRPRLYGGVELVALPTPGHTPGSMSYVADLDGRRYVFSGDLIRADGKLHSLAATQWVYNGLDGVVMTIVSALDVLDRSPGVLLPAHGDPILEPGKAIARVTGRLQELLDLRTPQHQIADMRAKPFQAISPHLLWNRTSLANSYILLSDEGAALVIDFGYDFWPFFTGFEYPSLAADRAARTPWLQTLPALKRDYGVQRVEVALPTHYHDDHVAGFNLLRAVEDTEVWAAENFAHILREPERHDLPCLWYDPVVVDRVLPVGQAFAWREYDLTLHELPGHTLYAVAIEFEVDGRRILATGDQQDGGATVGELEFTGYNYRNGFRIDDYTRSAELYRRIGPDIILNGHSPPREVSGAYLDALLETGRTIARLHRELLPLEELDFGAEGFGARIEPYRPVVRDGRPFEVDVHVRNPFAERRDARVHLVVPRGWDVEPREQNAPVSAHGHRTFSFTLTAPAGREARRVRIGADLSVGDAQFGLQAEALITVRSEEDSM